MKKFLGIVILAVFAFSACGGGDSDETPPATQDNGNTVETEEPQDGSTTTEETEEPVVAVEPTPTAQVVIPTPAPLIHTVQPGNSLSQIAQSYGVPIELLAAENGIEDYNLIQVGQEIVIPLIEDEEE